MRATRLSVANYNRTLSSDSLESGTGSSNSLRSATQSSMWDILCGVCRKSARTGLICISCGTRDRRVRATP